MPRGNNSCLCLVTIIGFRGSTKSVILENEEVAKVVVQMSENHRGKEWNRTVYFARQWEWRMKWWGWRWKGESDWLLNDYWPDWWDVESEEHLDPHHGALRSRQMLSMEVGNSELRSELGLDFHVGRVNRQPLVLLSCWQCSATVFHPIHWISMLKIEESGKKEMHKVKRKIYVESEKSIFPSHHHDVTCDWLYKLKEFWAAFGYWLKRRRVKEEQEKEEKTSSSSG